MGRPKGSKNKKKTYTCDAYSCYTESETDSDCCSDCSDCNPKKKHTTKKLTSKSKSKSKSTTSKSKPKKKTTRRKNQKDSSSSCSCSDCMDDYSSSDDAFTCGRGGFKCPLK